MAVAPVTDLELSLRRLVNVYRHEYIPFVGQWVWGSVERVCVCATQKALEARVGELPRGFEVKIGECDGLSHPKEIGLASVKYLTFLKGRAPCQPTQGFRHTQCRRITPPLFLKKICFH